MNTTPNPIVISPTIVCAWCKAVMTPGHPDHGISHGCCPPCQERALAELDPRD